MTIGRPRCPGSPPSVLAGVRWLGLASFAAPAATALASTRVPVLTAHQRQPSPEL